MDDFHDNVTSILEVRDATGSTSCIVASSLDGTVRSYDMRAGKCYTDNLGAPVGAVALSHDRNCILAALPSKSAAASTGGGGDLLLFERDRGAVLNRYSGGGHLHSVYRIIPALTSTDSHVVAPSEDGCVRFFDLVEGELAACACARSTHLDPAKMQINAGTLSATLQAHKRAVSAVAIHPSPLHSIALTASFDGTVKLWTAGKVESLREWIISDSKD